MVLYGEIDGRHPPTADGAYELIPVSERRLEAIQQVSHRAAPAVCRLYDTARPTDRLEPFPLLGAISSRDSNGGRTPVSPGRSRPYACFVREDTRIPFMAMPDAVGALLTLEAASLDLPTGK
jgi:hypothetical protein